jgi:hypothetical protein
VQRPMALKRAISIGLTSPGKVVDPFIEAIGTGAGPFFFVRNKLRQWSGNRETERCAERPLFALDSVPSVAAHDSLSTARRPLPRACQGYQQDHVKGEGF